MSSKTQKKPGSRPVRKGKQNDQLIVRRDAGKSKRGHSSQKQIRNDLQRDVARNIMVYTHTRWYCKAIEAGFSNLAALDKFREHVARLLDQIDPACVPVCRDCGTSDIYLCDCRIIGEALKGVTVNVDEDDSIDLLVPQVVNFERKFTWFEGVLKLFYRPTFNPKTNNNHFLAGYNNSSLHDDFQWDGMASFIRLNLNTSYVVDNKDRRDLRLAHAHKLAHRYMDVIKLRESERVKPEFVSRVIHTVQRVTDGAENPMLYAHTNPTHNLIFPWARVFLRGCVGLGFLTTGIYAISKLRKPIVLAVKLLTLQPVSAILLHCGKMLRLLFAPTTRSTVATALRSWLGKVYLSSVLTLSL